MHFSLYKTLNRSDLLRFGLIGTAVICALFVGGTLLHRQTVPTAAGDDFDRTVYLTFPCDPPNFGYTEPKRGEGNFLCGGGKRRKTPRYPAPYRV